MKYTKVDNNLIIMFDVVRFITANKNNKFNLSILDGVDDYRIILTHGVIGELLMALPMTLDMLAITKLLRHRPSLLMRSTTVIIKLKICFCYVMVQDYVT